MAARLLRGVTPEDAPPRAGRISRIADRLLNTTAQRGSWEIRPDVLEFHRSIPVVDLLVGTALFRPAFLDRVEHGHVDLPRLVKGGVDLVGLSIATRHPDLRGTFSTPHLRSLGIRVGRSNLRIAARILARIDGWAAASGGRLRILRTRDELAGVAARAGRDDGSHADSAGVDAFIGIQGGHVLDGDLRNIERLASAGVRMLALAHVMDNALVGSNTGVRRGGLTSYGRDVIAEMERAGMVVDLAHMSSAGIRDALPLLRRPFVLSHTGFTALSGRRSFRRFSPANRNLSTDDARLVGQAGGVIGVVCATQLLGGGEVRHLADAFRFAVELVGAEKVAIGSDFDGGLRATFDVTGLPLLTQSLLDGGLRREAVEGILGRNALRVLAADV